MNKKTPQIGVVGLTWVTMKWVMGCGMWDWIWDWMWVGMWDEGCMMWDEGGEERCGYWTHPLYLSFGSKNSSFLFACTPPHATYSLLHPTMSKHENSIAPVRLQLYYFKSETDFLPCFSWYFDPKSQKEANTI
jgi:hypothetical protein